MVRYAEIEDFERISLLWGNNLGEISPLKSRVSDIYELILNHDILMSDTGFCYFSNDTKTNKMVVHGIVDEGFEEYIAFISDISKDFEIDCLSTSKLSEYCSKNYTMIKNYTSKVDRLPHTVYTLGSVEQEDIDRVGDYRVVRCRFRNEKDLQNFAELNHIVLSSDVDWYKVETNEYGFVNKVPKSELKDNYWESEWWGMPSFEPFLKNLDEEYAVINFMFTTKDPKKISEFFHMEITDKTKSCWYPKLEYGEYTGYRVLGGDSRTRYPIYVVSKNRSENCYTSRILSKMEVSHYVVVEPQDYEAYCEKVQTEYATIVILDMSYKEKYDCFDDLGLTKSTGPGPARNFCWDDSIKKGYAWHWVFDDNSCDGFFYVYQNKQLKCHTGAFFRACEDFVDRYDNIAIAGLNYYSFYPKNSIRPAFTMNSRIYSFLLIRNDIPYRWRGRYNEDTDISLRVLKDNWCTVDFNAFLAGKATTQRYKGGNTEEFYAREGTLPKSKMLQDMHPDVARVSWKFGRWHHEVDYSGFRQKLHLREGYSRVYEPNQYGMYIVPTKEKEGYTYSKSELEEKYKKVIDLVNNEESQKNIFKYSFS